MCATKSQLSAYFHANQRIPVVINILGFVVLASSLTIFHKQFTHCIEEDLLLSQMSCIGKKQYLEDRRNL